MKDIEKAVSIQYALFEACCHKKVIEYICDKDKRMQTLPEYGCEMGFSSFVFTALTLDCSVYVFEMFKISKEILGNIPSEITDNPYYKDIKVVRNNIHAFYKGGGYKGKAVDIITKQIREYKIDAQDPLYPFRNDISLIFLIKGNMRYLIGSNYFVFHCIFESDTDWKGEDFKEYCSFLSQNICGFAKSVDDSIYKLPKISDNPNSANIELFDYKSIDLFDNAMVEEVTAFRLLLSLYQISYGIYLIDELIDKEDVLGFELWNCFFTKILSIKYDETLDNIESLIKYSNDKEVINTMIEKNSIILTGQTRCFARNLRNTIHYQKIKFNSDFSCGNTSSDWIKTVYLSNAEVKTMKEFNKQSNQLMIESKKLQKMIQDIFLLNNGLK